MGLNFRIDVVGLSTGSKPTTQIKDGTTYYTVDTQELYIYYNGEWYNQTNPIEESEDEQQESKVLEK